MKTKIFPALLLAITLILSACVKNNISSDNDWIQYKKDNYRSGVSQTKIDLTTLSQKWIYSAPHIPVPAWYGPAYEDAFANSGPLPSMRDYDLAYYPIIVGDKLFYASTSDDAIHCLDNYTGEELWRYTTNGPIHIAPAYHAGNLYFGSDDGYVYSIGAKKGKLNWKFSPSDQNQTKVLNNGRLISFWPIRTGVLVEDGKVYFGASMLPWKKSYFCAIDEKTGKVIGDDCYVNELENRSLEGSMASTGEKIIQPQGRIAPAFFDKKTGEDQGSLPGSGGCFVLVTEDEHIIHPQTSRKKSLHELSNGDQPDFMSFDGGKEIVVKGDTSYVLTDHTIAAYERSSQKLIWLRRNFKAHRIILAGDYIFAGATDTLFGISTKNGLPLWKAQVQGTVYALAAAGESIYASTGEGFIYCFGEGETSTSFLAQNVTQSPSIDLVSDLKITPNHTQTLTVYAGPFIEAISPQSVSVHFETLEAMDCSLTWKNDGQLLQNLISENKKLHEFILPVRKDFRYSAIISNADNQTLSFQYDNFFNFEKEEALPAGWVDSSQAENELVSNLLSSKKLGVGLCLVLGTSDTSIPLSVLNQSDHYIIQIDQSAKKINKLRNTLIDKDIYGQNWSVFCLGDIPLTQIRSNLASSVWVESANSFNPDQIIELIAPLGKAVIKGMNQNSEWWSQSGLSWQVETEEVNDALVLTKKQIENQGEWTHQYARPDNSAFGGESLWGSTSTNEFDVQWMGRPGPRFQTHRSGRKASPLAVSGKLFVQGKERLMAIDVYNGSVYWVRHIPGFIRMNIHRDCSNWAADNSHLYLAVNDKILKVNQETGDVDQIMLVDDSGQMESGYISIHDDFIVGSTSPAGSHFTDYHGGAGWYDWAEGPMAEKVISHSLFKKSKKDGSDQWRYAGKGVIINSTITHYQNQICFVESRTGKLKLSDNNRGKDDLFNKIYLVSLDLNTGKKLYEKALEHYPGKTAYCMAAGNGKIVILSSAESNYHIYTHSATDGELLWSDDIPWFHSNHGGHLSRPAIVGNKLIIKPSIYDLESGIQIDYNVPKSGHGCASYALTEQSIFYRGGSVTQFNFDTREFSRWERLRPDCWISTIPAQGMILSPEAGGGCSCGNWLETSMVIAPLSRAPITIERAGTDHLIDYKDETYGNYTQQYLPNEFNENMDVTISLRPNTIADIYYTIDGSEPSKSAELYSEPLNIKQSTEIKTVVYIKSPKGEQKYYRSKIFTKVKSE
ncbi:MAG: PQQ-binding-like beta-propeller repeat protein [Bacteroidetes bacterium]|nr:PQQ-binding-like beta-propeller repeat protein [Bacteroidota bacterium]